MRAALYSLATLAAVGLVIATAVYGQTQWGAAGNADRADRWSAPRGMTADEPMLLADNSGTFGAARKMQGSGFYSRSGSSSSDDTSQTETSAPRFNATAGTTNETSGGAAGQSAPPANSSTWSTALRQPSARAGGPQSVYPNENSGNAPSTNSSLPKARSAASDTGDMTGNSGGGLRALQQRLSAVRKSPSTSSPPSGAAGSSVRPPVVEYPSMPTARPAAGIPSVAARRAADTGPIDGPVPPSMPNIQAIQLPATADEPIAERGNVSPVQSGGLRSNGPVVSIAKSPSSPSAPVVGGPLSSSRRVTPTPAASESAGNASEPDSSGSVAGSNRIAPPVRASIAPPADKVLFARQSPLMGVETTGPRSITVGKEATYSIAISNAGDVAAQDVLVAIKIPEWTEVVGTKATSGVAGAVSEQRGEPLVWRLARLEGRSKEQLVVRLIPRASKPFDLAVQWTCSPVASQAMVEVKEPKLTMTLDGPPEVLYGQTKVYRLMIANPGSGDAENVLLYLAPVDGGPGSPSRHDVGLIRAGESKPVEVELTARQAGTLTVKAAAVAEGNLRAEVAEEILVRRAGLKTVATGPELKFAGTPTTYSIMVANPGNAPAENVSVAALLPPGAKYISSGGGQFVEGENKVVWTLASLRAGAEQELEVRCALNTPGTNRLQVLSTAASDLSDSLAVVTNVEALADLKLEVTDPAGPLAVGEEMQYEVHIRNRGTKAAENVDVAGFFSNGIEPLTAQGGQHEISAGQVVFRPIPSIAPGAEAVFKIKARADLAGTHVFRAEVNCPSVGAKLASEETTLFYGDGRGAARTANRPGTGPQQVPGSGTPPSGTLR